jgi:hypothetical protein
LFIDEAYSLAHGGNDYGQGQKAIDILIKDMEDKRDNYIVMLAGYDDEIKDLLLVIQVLNRGFLSSFISEIIQLKRLSKSLCWNSKRTIMRLVIAGLKLLEWSLLIRDLFAEIERLSRQKDLVKSFKRLSLTICSQ